MLEYYYLSSAINAAKNLPKEMVYAAAAGLTINELHKRQQQTKRIEIEVNAKTKAIELEVEKLRLQLALRESRIDHPDTPSA
jgi:hypothetical protein